MLHCPHCNSLLRREVFTGPHIDGQAVVWICSESTLFGGECRSNVAYLGEAPAVEEHLAPKFKPGDVVYIRKVGKTKTVVSADRSYGHELRYVLKENDGTLDEGWREDELELADVVAKGGE